MDHKKWSSAHNIALLTPNVAMASQYNKYFQNIVIFQLIYYSQWFMIIHY